MAKRKEKVDESQLINSAIGDGIDAIMKQHPRFRENQEYIMKHLNQKKLHKKINEIYSGIQEKDWDNEKKIEYLHHELADYVATGRAFDEAGKEIILKGSLEAKAKSGFFRGLFARRELEGEKYLNNTVDAFQDLYALFQKGDHAQRMPEVAEAIGTINDLGFLDPALDVLKHYRLIDKKRYSSLKKDLMKKTAESAQYAVKGIEKYATTRQTYQKAAAFIFGALGLLTLFASGTKITGNIVGNSSNVLMGLITGFLMLASLILFKKSFKNK